jgi:hypothetical protein
MTRIRALPGVQSASAVMPLPLSGDRFGISFQIEGRPVAPKDEPSADMFVADTNYFRTMGIPIVKGRDFQDRDQHSSTPVVIITEQFARQYFPGEDPVGKRIHPGISTWDNEDSTMREIIGVAGDIRNRALSTEPRPAYYMPQSQLPFTQLIGVVKSTNDPRALTSSLTREVRAMDPELPVFSVKTMEEYISSSVAAPRFNTTLLSIFAAVATGPDHHRFIRCHELLGPRSAPTKSESAWPWSSDAGRSGPDCQRWHEAGAAGFGAGHFRSACLDAFAFEFAFWGYDARPGDFRSHRGAVVVRGDPRLLHTGVASDESRSARGAAV